MKSKFLSFLLGPLFSLSPLFAQNFDPLGEEENQYLPRMIRVQMEFIEIPHTEYTKIMKKPRKTANDDDLRSACDALIESGKGKVLESTCVIAKPGLKATSGSILEYIYPTEYEPAMGAETVTDKDGKQTAVHGTNAPTPTTFDTKNLGLSFEIEPNLGANDSIVDLRIAPSLIYHVGNESWGQWKGKDVDVTLGMPSFYVLRFSTGTTLLAGQQQMVTALSPKTDKGELDSDRKIMTFLRADVLTVGR